MIGLKKGLCFDDYLFICAKSLSGEDFFRSNLVNTMDSEAIINVIRAMRNKARSFISLMCQQSLATYIFGLPIRFETPQI